MNYLHHFGLRYSPCICTPRTRIPAVPYANSLKTKAVNAKIRPTCALVAGLGPLSLLFVFLTSLMEFEIRAEHAQKPRMCRCILGDDNP